MLIQANPIPSLTVGNRLFTDLGNLIILAGIVSGAGAKNCTLRKLNASAGYTPSGATQFKIHAVRIRSFDANVTSLCLGYADNDAGWFGVAAFTNAVGMVGAGATGTNVLTNSSNAGSQGVYEECLNGLFAIPNGKYGFFSNTGNPGSASIWVYGYEV